MLVLISPVSYAEAVSIVDTGVDILDAKNVDEGSLGAQRPWHTARLVELAARHNIQTSAALGDLAHQPGTAALAAYGAAQLGVNYVKAGLYGSRNYAQARDMLDAICRSVRMASNTTEVVAAGYADYRCFDGLPPVDLIRAAKDSQCDVVMLDTSIKDGRTLFDHLSLDELREFKAQAEAAGLKVALAGSLRLEHANWLLDLAPHIVGVRGAACRGRDRQQTICPEQTCRLVTAFHQNANVPSA